MQAHPMFPLIRLIQGSSIDTAVLRQVKDHCKDRGPVIVVLDSNHSHDHVSTELDLYSPLVTAGSYLVVFDTVVEDMPEALLAQTNRAWGRGNNPKTAVRAFLQRCDRFVVDELLETKLQITVSPSGYLKCVR
jgi:cephalosporin hydroxylase